MKGLIGNLMMRGARAVVLACAELPLAVGLGVGIGIIDPTETWPDVVLS